VKRVLTLAGAMGLLVWLAACSGGGGSPDPNVPTTGPLTIVFAAASPNSGGSPLRVSLTANITGGEAPYFYAWDFTNDGSFDEFRNNIFLRTLSVQHDYYQVGGVDTAYQAVLRVTDSKNTVVTSDPVDINVTTSTGLQVTDVIIFSNEQTTTGTYILRSGQPIFFRPTVTGGRQPYTFQWDFDNNGSVDSTLQNTEYTYSFTGAGARTFIAKLKVVDATGNFVNRDVLVIVEGEDTTPGTTDQPFSIVILSDPAADANGVITINWDTSANNPDLPLEPGLDLSVIVDDSQGGRAPFEYYWDFENDGAFDSQAVSPTIPYYDPVRKILVNPYLHLEKSKTYTLRVFVIDSRGQMQQLTRTIISNNQENSVGKLQVDDLYGVADVTTGVFTQTPPLPYNLVSGPLTETDIKYQVTASNGSGTYDWQLDVDGDGTADYPALADEPDGFKDVPVGGVDSTVVKFGFFDDGAGNQISDWPALGYYASNAVVRSLNGTQVVETFKVQMPVSLVRRDPVAITGGAALLPRRDMVLVGQSAPAAAGANGNFIPSRRAIIAGGFQGTTPLRDVQQILQTFDEPTAANTLELAVTADASVKVPMNQPRAGAVGTTDGTDVFVIGGQNLDNGILGSTENQPFATNSGWTAGGEIRIPQFYPLFQAGGTFVPVAVGSNQPGFYFAGGLNPGGFPGVNNVSNRVIFTDLSDANAGAPGIQLGFAGLGGTMVTPRYDVTMAFANNRLYVMGGRVSSGRSVSTVEAYNLITSQWENVASLLDDRSGASAEVIDDGTNAIIYVHGGAFYPGNEVPGGGTGDREVVNTSEAYNPRTGVWSYTVPIADGLATENGDTATLAGAGSAASLPAVINQIWYFGGAAASQAESNALWEFTYFYTITPTP
jgi:PKD repeat protein